MNQRELGRKERSIAEANRYIKRYKNECGEVVTYHLNKDELEQIKSGKKTFEQIKKGQANNES